MERRDFDYYEVRLRDVLWADVASCADNRIILRRLLRQDTSLKTLTISDDADDDYFGVGEGDDLGWLGYFIGKSIVLEQLFIYSWGEGGDIEAFIDRFATFVFAQILELNNNSLTSLELNNFEVGLECAQSIAHALGESQCQSLKYITIEECNLSDEGFAVIATALGFQPQLESLDLERNNIGLTGCTAFADTLRGWGASNLQQLDLNHNDIDDQGLQVLATAMTNAKIKGLNLSDTLITAVGLRSLSTYFQSDSCCLNTLHLHRVHFGDEGAVILAEGLTGNKSLKNLDFDPDESGITDVGWAAFSKLLCDPSSIESTYHSNHNIKRIGEYEMFSTPLQIIRYLDLNEHPHPANNKILESHPNLDMEPFFQWKLKLLPVVINWFQSAGRQSLQSRELSALYKFVRGMPALTVISYWQQQVINIQARRRRLDVEEETAWVRLGGRPRDAGNVEFIQIGAKRMRQE